MATTAKGTPYVESTDLVANYPAASLALANHIDDFGGEILQVVRATDATQRTTTSVTYVDASISVTITPKRNTSAILLIWALSAAHSATADYTQLAITDNSNNIMSGAEGGYLGSGTTAQVFAQIVIVGYSTPATLSATTYKGRFRNLTSGTAQIYNDAQTGQLYAIEVSA